MRFIVRLYFFTIGTIALLFTIFLVSSYLYSRHVVQYDYQLTAWPDKSDFGKPVEMVAAAPRRVRILAIDGGALFGLADLEVLKAIEEKSGKPIFELFDFVAGSSTGAIISTLLLHPDKQTGKPMSAEDAIHKYEQFSGQVLDGPLYHKILTAYGLFGPRLTNQGRIKSAKITLGNSQFRELLRPTMFPAYSQKNGGLKVFRNWDHKESNLYLWSLLTAVTSVPSVFPAVTLIGDDTEDYFYGDPAFISNEPGDLAYLHARSHFLDADEFVVVSLGTARSYTITRNIGIRGGLIQWISPAFNLLYRGETTMSQGPLERHAAFDSTVDVSLVVLSPTVADGTSSFTATPSNIAYIKQAGRHFVRDNENQIDALVTLLAPVQE